MENAKVYARNNLDKFFEDLYREELKLVTDKSDVKFIKHAIECLVQSIAKLVFVHGQTEIESIKRDYMFAYPGLTFLDNVDNVIKVGSIYDKTRNGYHDEFDFVMVIFAFFCESDMKTAYIKFGYTYKEKFTSLHQLIRKLLSKKNISESLIYRDPQEKDKEMKFVTYVRFHKCSSKLRFEFKKENSTHYINVDFVLSTKRIDPDLDLKNLSTSHLFNIEIAHTGSVLYVNENVAFTETEVTFLKKVMSHKHRKTYRILKYLINGHKEGEMLENMLYKSGLYGERITSYMIKTEMILHHCSCHRTDRVITPCIMDVLCSLRYYDSSTSLPSLTHEPHVAHFFRPVDKLCALEEMIDTLSNMQKSTKPYRFDKDEIIPIAKSLLVYQRQPTPVRTKTKPVDWLECIGTYSINTLEVFLAVFLFVVFLVGLIQQL